MKCPKCKQLVASRDHKHYGVHFAQATDQRPCEMSCKPIETEAEQKEKEQNRG